MNQYRYPCSRCLLGSHSTPRCPHLTDWDPPTTVELHRQVLHLNRVAADARRSSGSRGFRSYGPIEDRYRTPSRFRLWWIPIGFVVFLALVILI